MSDSIKIVNIEIPPRLRETSQPYVEILAENIKLNGVLQPVLVHYNKGGAVSLLGAEDGAPPLEEGIEHLAITPLNPPHHNPEYILIDGAHRLAACKLLDFTEIKAEIVEFTPEQAKLAEIDANLIRHELNALDRATFLTERKEIWVEINGKPHGGDRGNQHTGGKRSETLDMFAEFSKTTQQLTGLSPSTINRDIAMYNNLGAETKAALQKAKTPFSNGALRKIANYCGDYTKQAEIVRLMVDDPKEFSQPYIAEMCVADPEGFEANRLRNAQLGHQQKTVEVQLTALRKAWSPANQKSRNEFMQWAGLRIELGER